MTNDISDGQYGPRTLFSIETYGLSRQDLIERLYKAEQENIRLHFELEVLQKGEN